MTNPFKKKLDITVSIVERHSGKKKIYKTIAEREGKHNIYYVEIDPNRKVRVEVRG